MIDFAARARDLLSGAGRDDFAARARDLLLGASRDRHGTVNLRKTAEAQVLATLALVEEQRTANLIAIESMAPVGVSGNAERDAASYTRRADIRARIPDQEQS